MLALGVLAECLLLPGVPSAEQASKVSMDDDEQTDATRRRPRTVEARFAAAAFLDDDPGGGRLLSRAIHRDPVPDGL